MTEEAKQQPEAEVLDAELVVEEAPGGAHYSDHVDVGASSYSHAAAGAALAVRPASREVLMPLDSQAVIQGMQAYQRLLHDLLDDSDWQQTGDGKFLKKSGWRKIARAFNLSVTKISDRVERDAEGNPLRAEVVVRAIAPNGTVQDGDGYCAASESRFSRAAGRQKLENDLRATATTRAKNRAISDLVGMGEVSAEEVVQGGGGADVPKASDKQVEELREALKWLVPRELGADLWERLKGLSDGRISGPVAVAVTMVITARKGLEELPPQKESAAQRKAREKKEKQEAKAAAEKQDKDATAPDDPPPEDAAEKEGKDK